MKGKYKRIAIIFASITFIITSIILILSTIVHKKVDNQLSNLNSENRRAANYTVITDSSTIIPNTQNNVRFSAFFTRDLDGDGNAEKYDGTCKNINSKDTLYIDLNVLTEGKLKDGKITINGTNFNYSMGMIKDTVLKENYLSDDVKEIKLNDVNAGTEKIIFGKIIANIGNDTTNYSKQSTITLTGTYIDDNNNETEINVTRNVTIDWYGNISASLYTKNSKYYYNNLNTDIISFDYYVYENEEDLLLKDIISTAVIPDLNGFAPTNVTCINRGVDAQYDEQTKTITLKRSSSVDENGIIQNSLSRNNSFTINVTYPQQAFDQINSYTTLEIPITGQYVGYNNKNEEFENPINSNIANGKVIIVFEEQVETGYAYNFDIKFADKKYVFKPYSRYVISKQDLLNLYDNEEYIADYDYEVNWYANKGNLEKVNSFIMNETINQESSYGDKFDEFVMDNYTLNKGIYFTNADNVLGSAGTINVYNNDTNELIKTFTCEDWNKYIKQSPYKYEIPIKHIRVETTSPANNTTLIVHNIKTWDAKKITQDYTKEQIKNVNMVYTYLTGIADVENSGRSQVNDIDSAYFVSETSYAELDLSNVRVSTQETTNEKIYIKTSKTQSEDAKWKNGQFIVEFPEEIINAEINSVEIDNSNVKILGYDILKENGKFIVRILTENNEPDLYTITIDTQITPDSRISTTSKNFKLYAYNANCNEYYYTTTDIYDVDNNGNIEEKVGTSSKNLELLSPTSLVTLETVSNYNEENSITIAPNVAEVDKEIRQAKINLNITNNYPNTVTGVKILGKIPYKDNTYIINGRTMNSEFDTTMVNTGIHSSASNSQNIDNETKIYYSEKENPTTDITNSENEWKLLEDVTDFSKIKSYLINMNKYEIKVGEEVKFDYDVILPENLPYNIVSYSNHAVYFDLQTDGGKLTLATEPAKVGIKIVSQYDLDLTKYKKCGNIKVAGAVYSLTYIEKDTEGVEQTRNKIIITNSEGKCIVKNLNVNVEYKLKEIKSPNICELNDDEVIFKINETGELICIGNTKEKSFSINDKTLKISVEDEVKYNLILNKTKLGTDFPINNVRFSLIDEEGNKEIVKIINGTATIEALSLNKEYTLNEIVTPGNVELNNGIYKFKLIRNNNGIIEVQVIENSLAKGNGVITDSADELIPEFTVNVENEIKYNLNINKIDLEGNKINGARFKISGKDFDDNSEYISSNGILTIPNLHINETYTIEETKNLGYYLDSEKDNKIIFKVTRGINELEVSSLTCGDGISISGNANIIENGLEASINVTVQNEKIPTYNLNIIKQNERQELISGAEFKLTSLDDNTEQTIIIDEQGNGTFTGLYEYVEGKPITGEYTLQEIYAPEGYRLDTTIWKFKGARDENGNIVITSIEGDNIIKKNETTDEQTGNTVYTNAITTTANDATVTILNKTIFKLTKIGDLGKFLPGAKFKITDLDGNSVTGVDGNEIGIIETDENGQISANLGEGLYKVTEIEVPEGYELPANIEDRTYYFGIGANKPGITSGQIDKMEWANSVSAKYLAEFNDTVATPDGGIIAVGCAKREIDINGDGEQDTQGFGGNDAVIVKYNENGSIAWTRVLGGKYEDELYTIAKVPNGGYVVAGYVEGGDIYYNGTQIDSSDFGNEDGIIVKIDENGNYIWSQSIGGIGTDRINSITVNDNGDIGVTGSYYNTIYTDKDNSATLSTTAEANKGGFVSVYSSTGSYKWSQNLIGSQDVFGKAITATSNGFVVGANFQNDISFGGSSSVSTKGQVDSIVICYDNNGIVQWTRQIGSTLNDAIYDLAVYNDPDTEGQKDIVVVGAYGNAIDIDGDGTSELTSKGYYDGMIIKLKETDGNLVKASSIGGSNDIVISSVIPTSDGGLVIGGWSYADSAVYGTTTINTKGSNVDNNGFILKLDKSDSLAFSDVILGDAHDQVNSVAESTNKGIYAVGDFGSKSLNAKGEKVLSNTYTYDSDAFVIKYGETIVEPEVPELREITISNELLKFTITTEIGANNFGKREGGTITGIFDDDNYKESNNIRFVENIKYGYDNSKDIVIKPNAEYEIQNITIDGEKYIFTPDETTGIVTIPAGYFKDVKENHHIVATFVSSSKSVKIVKKDKDGNLLEGAKFEIKSNNNIPEFGELTANGITYASVDKNREITDVVGDIQNNGTTYYFTESDGTYIPNNKGISSSTAYSYFPIDLTNYEGTYQVVVTAKVSSEHNCDIGYATINEETTDANYNIEEGRFVYISGTSSNVTNEKEYTSQGLVGGKKYYLHVGYRKDGSANTGDDIYTLTGIKVYGSKNVNTFDFQNTEGKYISNNTKYNDTYAYSYIPLDLTNYYGEYKITVNTQISATKNDCGFVTVGNTTTQPKYIESQNRFVCRNGTGSAMDNSIILVGGQMYYIHFGYYNGNTDATNDDTFTINSINVEPVIKTYTATTDVNGQATIELDYIGKYTIQEIEAPEHYILNNTKTEFELLSTDKNKTVTIENTRKTGIIIHHYLKQSDGTLTTNKVAEDEQYEGIPGEEYTTSPKSNLDKLSLQKDSNGEYVIPENGSGTYGNEEIEVIYYYEPSPMKLTIHHYLEGTEDKLADDETILTNSTVTFDENGKYTVSANNIYTIANNSNYQDLLTDYIFTKVTTQREDESGGKGDITYAEITDTFEYSTNSEVTYYYTLKTHNITTQVKTHKENRTNELTNKKEEIEVAGGTVTGEYNSTYTETDEIKFVETVKQKDNSIAEITATPDAGYKVSKITLISTADDGTQTETIIYGNGISETSEVTAKLNTDKTVSITTFKSVIANKHIIVEFEPLNGQVITHHIIKGQTTDYETIASSDLIGEPYYTGSIDIEHYKLVETSDNTEGKYTEDKIDVYYYYDIASYEYSVHYFYDGVEDTTKTEKSYAKYQETISNYTDKNIDGYKFKKVKALDNNGVEGELPLIIKDDSNKNVINVYYVKDNFEYSVHYFYDGIEDTTKIEKANAEFAGEISTYTDKVIEGYKFEKVKALDNEENETELPLIIKSDKNKNIINVYYIKDDFGYTVHYFYDGIEDLTKLETKEAEFEEEILTYSDKNKPGYKLEKAKALDDSGVEGELPLIIKTDIDKNVINIYYVKDEFEYTVHYFYDGVEDTNLIEKLKATYQDTISTYTDNNKTGYALEKTEYLPLQITDNPENNVINIYYKTQYKITTDVIEHTEKYTDGTVKNNVKGGSISGEDLDSYENVFKGESSTKDIIIKPDDGYEIKSVIIKDSKDATTGINLDIDSLKDENGIIKINASNGYFTEMSSNKHIEVKFRKKSNVIVKYLEKETNKVLAEEVEITGYEGETYETSRKPIEYYNSAGQTYEDNTPYDETADNKMYADTTTIIYWYEKMKSDILVRHIEIDEKEIKDGLTLNSGKLLDETSINGDVLASKDISRNTYENTHDEKYKKLIGINGPEVTIPGDENIILIIASKNDNLKTVEFIKDTVTELRYYYIKQYDVTTEVILHDEEIVNPETGEKQTVEVAGGTISTEYAKDENGDFVVDSNGNKIALDVYEKINNRGYNKKAIEIIPDAGYRVKKVVINDKTYTKEELNEDTNHKVILKCGNDENSDDAFFKDVQEDKKVSVEFERIPAKIVVEYIDVDTNERINTDKEINGYVGDEYNEDRIQIDSYIPADKPTENNKGIMTEDTIRVIFYYTKQFEIITDVIEHMELVEIPVVDVKVDKDETKEDSNQDGTEEKETEETGKDNSANEGETDKDSESSEKKFIKVKGGTITGEDEQPYEIVLRGKENNKEIVLKPDDGYRIKYFTIYDGIEENYINVDDVVEKDGKQVIITKYNDDSKNNTYIIKEEDNVIIPIKYFKNTQSDKKIVVEYERIPSKVIVNYKDKDSNVNIVKQEQGRGYLNLKYKTHPKEIQYYKLLEDELPENAEGKFEKEDIIVTYLYRKLLFNMKVEKEFSSIEVNGVEKLGSDKKLAKIDIANTKISETNILVKYKIIVTNTEELPGKAKLIENIPVGFKVSDLISTDWKKVDGKLQLVTQELQPGESAEYEVILEWDTNMKCIGDLENVVEIAETENGAGFAETTLQDNKDRCTLILAVRTGENRDIKTIISISCFVLAGICSVIYVGVEVWNRKKK